MQADIKECQNETRRFSSTCYSLLVTSLTLTIPLAPVLPADDGVQIFTVDEIAVISRKSQLLDGTNGLAHQIGAAFSIKGIIGSEQHVPGDINESRKPLAEKARLRSIELTAAEGHLDGLRQGLLETLETTSLHLDVIRDLTRIHSLICSVAYPVLDAVDETVSSEIAESDPIALIGPKQQKI
jgi:hypothetical protein